MSDWVVFTLWATGLAAFGALVGLAGYAHDHWLEGMPDWLMMMAQGSVIALAIGAAVLWLASTF